MVVTHGQSGGQVIGGEERLAHEATKTSEAYWNFIKIWQVGDNLSAGLGTPGPDLAAGAW